MAKWFTDPTEVPAAPPRQEGGWQFSFRRTGAGGQRARRKWEGARPAGVSWLQMAVAPRTQELLPSWSPTASQFPWQTSQGVTSDPQRQAAFNLGLGGTRPTRIASRAAGTFFDPGSGFRGTGTAAIMGGSRTRRATTPTFPTLPQPITSGYPWMSQGAQNIYNRMTRGVRKMMRR